MGSGRVGAGGSGSDSPQPELRARAPVLLDDADDDGKIRRGGRGSAARAGSRSTVCPCVDDSGHSLLVCRPHGGSDDSVLEDARRPPGVCRRPLGARANASREREQRAGELSGNSAYMRAHLAYGLARAGNRDRAMSIQRELTSESQQRYQPPYHEALIALGLGDRAAMMRALERALADRSGWMVFLPV